MHLITSDTLDSYPAVALSIYFFKKNNHTFLGDLNAFVRLWKGLCSLCTHEYTDMWEIEMYLYNATILF